ncbi:hypothetical protein AGLY_016562 [Aphis glycines]|uniref:MULE transposase domain-containing protein n=1 Tax=Aphis glycines TaxID=307491 RepID=A0A6G0SZ18_APHGL|nr:hypothetical protein AGLY_016562 [Aphis glycines]
MICPPSFKYEIVRDDYVNITLRCDVKSMEDISVWIAEFGKLNYLNWNVRTSVPNGQRIVCSGFQKLSISVNQKGLSKNAECPANVKAVIKLDTVSTRKKDPFIKLVNLSKSSMTSNIFIPAGDDVKNMFYEYFNSGMGIAESQKYHEQLLEIKEDFTLEYFANGGINPCYRTVHYWHDIWRSLSLGPRSGDGLIERYPNLFLTDQSSVEINAINNVWPKSNTLLCTFHVLQAFWRDSYSRGYVTNNYCEVVVRLYKDHVLDRVKAYNVLALIDLTSTALEDYYKRRLREFADSRNSSIRLIANALAGKFWKHQYAIFQYFNIKSDNFPSITATDRFNIAKIAFGEQVLDKLFYDPFLKVEAVIEQRNETHTMFQLIIAYGIKKLEQRLKKIKSKGQWESFLHTAGNCVPLRNRDGATVKVQPTTIARQSAGITKDSKRLLAGRPPLGENVAKKRKRNLNQNIICNQPNAKTRFTLNTYL